MQIQQMVSAEGLVVFPHYLFRSKQTLKHTAEEDAHRPSVTLAENSTNEMMNGVMLLRKT
jgi:hypothetical protein